MGDIEGVTADRLRERLREVESAKAAKRLMVALAYLDGESVDALSERYGVPRSTLYYWLDRFESRSLADAVADDPRPGRPPRLSEGERAQLRADLTDLPGEHGLDADAWEPAVVQRHLERAYGVSYSVGHVRRLLREFDEEA